ncbi:uncharacterized protein Tco025E_07168 [Trypanosoma conorhini]|uniref:Uncharacterized protein n=1 Tax=Trypanosoma conorhini TaxID=83891 RepID=A0A422NSN8_9TRYP|nr:uncharacterized protein Tco025E_07168 [Trypanosoma conorhini]RNF08473.1 hypothetical protein Tco025E_07168 [Trypanosoma conorhini]
MGLKDTTSGFYGDVPYCSPVESSVFFDTITASRMHRLPESMITRADSTSFFMDANASLYERVLGVKKEVDNKKSCPKGGSAFEFLDIIPHLFRSPSASRLVRASEEGDCFVVVESKNISDICGVFEAGKQDSSSVYFVVSLDLKGIDDMWQSLLNFLLGGVSPGRNMVYVLRNVEVYLEKGNSYGAFLFSLWALAVSSILHNFASITIDSVRQRLSRVSIRICVLEGHEGENILDDIQLFFENKLRICVYRVLSTDTLPNDACTIDSECDTMTETHGEWIDKATELVVGIHEELCDTAEEEPSKDDINLRCILVSLPEKELLRKDLQRHLCDSYTSTPVTVVTTEKQICEMLASHDRTIPIVFFVPKRIFRSSCLNRSTSVT